MKTTLKNGGFFVIILLSGIYTQAQHNISCPNLDFSQGNFTNWLCRTSTSQYRPSTAYNDLIWSGTNPVATRHTIMTNIYGYDSNTCNGNPNSRLSLIPNGFMYSARIGNDSSGSQVDAIVYQMTVDSSNALLLMHFAVVFQDPGHSADQQPYFEIRIQDSLGNLFNIPCNRYILACGAGLSGFQDCGSDIHWRDWETVAISLNALIGQKVYVVIVSADCGAGGHFGYGYFVGECRPMKINVLNCCTATVTRLEAPEGFVSYVWRGPNGSVIGTNQKLSLQSPADSSQYTVAMTSAIGCTSILTYAFHCVEVFAGFICDSSTIKCFPSKVTLTSASRPKNNHILYWEWNISKISENKGTEYIGIDSNFSYTFKDTGCYKIFYTVYADDGCADTASAIVYSYPSIDVKITAPSVICKNTETEIIATGADVYEWTNVKRIQSDSSAIVDKQGIYSVKGIIANGCGYDTVSVDDKEFNILYTTKNNQCIGMDSGEILITGLIGEYVVPVYHYWEDLGGTISTPSSVRTNLPAGKYFVYSIDSNHCFRYDTIEITEPLALGTIGQIIGDTLITDTLTYTYSITSVQEASFYRWFADEITQKGKIQLFDSVLQIPSVVISVKNNNPVQLNVYAFNDCDTTDTASLLINSNVDISENSIDKGIYVYPNPATDQITIQSKDCNLEEIKIYDVVGKEVKAQTANSIESILNLGDLRNGLYIICVKTEKGIFTTKILKK